MAKSRFIATILLPSAPACAYLTTGDASNLLLIFPISFAEADHHIGSAIGDNRTHLPANTTNELVELGTARVSAFWAEHLAI